MELAVVSSSEEGETAAMPMPMNGNGNGHMNLVHHDYSPPHHMMMMMISNSSSGGQQGQVGGESSKVIIRYRECLKNHAAAMGGTATDGCGEFMPSGGEQAGSIQALNCSACHCHRNFHRKQIIQGPPDHHRRFMLQQQNKKKRHRTKFTAEQKEKMLGFAEKVGWKIQKQEESVVQQFCQDIGVKRRVLKVWMHNNKHSLSLSNKNRLLHPPPPPPQHPSNIIN